MVEPHNWDTSTDPDPDFDVGYTAKSFGDILHGIADNALTLSVAINRFNDTITEMMEPDGVPHDFKQFLEAHETYDQYDEVLALYASPWGNIFRIQDGYKKFSMEYDVWKQYPNREPLRPGRQIITGQVLSIAKIWDKWGGYRKITVLLEDKNLVTFREPKAFHWALGDEVPPVAVTVDVLESPHHGQGSNPRFPRDVVREVSAYSVSEFLNTGDTTF